MISYQCSHLEKHRAHALIYHDDMIMAVVYIMFRVLVNEYGDEWIEMARMIHNLWNELIKYYYKHGTSLRIQVTR